MKCIRAFLKWVVPCRSGLSHAEGTNGVMTSSNGSIFRVTSPLCGEFTGPGEFPTQRPVTRSFDGVFDLPLNKRLSKQPGGWWFETLSWSLWRQCNEDVLLKDFVKTWSREIRSLNYPIAFKFGRRISNSDVETLVKFHSNWEILARSPVHLIRCENVLREARAGLAASWGQQGLPGVSVRS